MSQLTNLRNSRVPWCSPSISFFFFDGSPKLHIDWIYIHPIHTVCLVFVLVIFFFQFESGSVKRPEAAIFLGRITLQTEPPPLYLGDLVFRFTISGSYLVFLQPTNFQIQIPIYVPKVLECSRNKPLDRGLNLFYISSERTKQKRWHFLCIAIPGSFVPATQKTNSKS